jgi:hypothetical protein
MKNYKTPLCVVANCSMKPNWQSLTTLANESENNEWEKR